MKTTTIMEIRQAYNRLMWGNPYTHIEPGRPWSWTGGTAIHDDSSTLIHMAIELGAMIDRINRRVGELRMRIATMIDGYYLLPCESLLPALTAIASHRTAARLAHRGAMTRIVTRQDARILIESYIDGLRDADASACEIIADIIAMVDDVVARPNATVTLAAL
jgi:hypothetical protein